MQPITPTAFALAEHKRNVWQAYPEPEQSPGDFLDPAAWAHVAASLRAYDRIEALSEDGSWWAEYLVVETGPNWAKVRLLRSHELRDAGAEIPISDDYEIKLRGIRKYSVLRKADNQVLKDGFPHKEEAIGWLAEHLKAMAA